MATLTCWVGGPNGQSSGPNGSCGRVVVALIDVEWDFAEEPIPDDVAAFLTTAQEATRVELDRDAGDAVFAFVPSDYALAYRALAAIAREGLAPGRLFCEWGSGLGVVTTLAARAGFRAHGIEIEGRLVDEARRLNARGGWAAEFVRGTFVPNDHQEVIDLVDEVAWLDPGGVPGYEELERDPDEFDVVFAYPWPGEEEVVEELFDLCVARDALLLTFHGREGIKLRRRR